MDTAIPPVNKKIMGIDVGTATLGIALSDRGHVIATPYKTIRRGKWQADLAALKDIIQSEEVGMMILGLPLNMDGTEGARCQSVRQLARNIKKDPSLSDFLIDFWDERLSTAAVERVLIDENLSRSKRADKVDAAAAAYILEGFLARIRYQKG